jgi:O-antigen/teichoic acid export membrane protein
MVGAIHRRLRELSELQQHRRGLLTHAASLGLTRVITLIFGVAGSIIVARALSLEDRGLYALVITTSLLGIQFGTLGLPAANTYLISNRPHLSQGILANTTMWFIVSMIVITIIEMVLVVTVPSLVWMWSGLGVAVLAITATGLSLQLAQSILMGQLQIGSSNIAELIARIGTVAAMSSLWLIGVTSAASFVTVIAVMTGIAVIYAIAKTKISVRPRAIDPPLIRRQMTIGVRSYIACLLSAWTLIPMYTIEARSGSENLAYYHQAAQICTMALIVPIVISTVLYPRLGKIKNTTDRIGITLYSYKISVVVMIIIVVGILVTSPWIIPLFYGDRYLPSVPLLMYMTPGVFGLGLCAVTQNSLFANGYPWMSAFAPAVGLVIMLIGLAFFKTMEAAAWSFSAAGMSMCLASLVTWWCYRHATDQDRIRKDSSRMTT